MNTTKENRHEHPYPPPENFAPKTIWTGDNLEVMRGLNTDSVDMIYLDPPFNSNAYYGDPISDDKPGFDDIWKPKNIDTIEHGLLAKDHEGVHAIIEGALHAQGQGTMAYLVFMATRLIEMERLLKPTGHIFLHCDDSAVHHLRNLLDAIFGKDAYRNQITWQRSAPKNDAVRTFGRTADYILHYSRADAKFNPQYEPHNEEYKKTGFNRDDNDGRGRYTLAPLDKPKGSPGYHYDWMGYATPANGWRCPESTMQEHHDQGILHYPVNDDGSPAYSKRIRKKHYLTDYKGARMGNVWTDIPPMQEGDPEFMNYPTQKPPKLLERIVSCSTRKGDLVFDPFCGCATTLVAAEVMERQWIGCDSSSHAVDLLVNRLVEKRDLLSFNDIIPRDDLPVRTDIKKLKPVRDHKQELFGNQRGYCVGCWARPTYGRRGYLNFRGPSNASKSLERLISISDLAYPFLIGNDRSSLSEKTISIR